MCREGAWAEQTVKVTCMGIKFEALPHGYEKYDKINLHAQGLGMHNEVQKRGEQ